MVRSAVIDPTGQYRYVLSRIWNNDAPAITWVMLNPSTADANVDDPTIRRCINFSMGWGYGKLHVVNLYAYRATNPTALKGIADPFGPDFDVHFLSALHSAVTVVAAWGACPHASSAHIRAYLENYMWHCLGVTKDGSPRHPLYVKGSTELQVLPLIQRKDSK